MKHHLYYVILGIRREVDEILRSSGLLRTGTGNFLLRFRDSGHSLPCSAEVDCVWNVMAHMQKSDFVFRRNGRFHLTGASVQSTAGSRGVRISGSNAGYTMFRGSVKSNGYPIHSPVSPSVPLPCVTVCHHIATGVYHPQSPWKWDLGHAIEMSGHFQTTTLLWWNCITDTLSGSAASAATYFSKIKNLNKSYAYNKFQW
jgi:hypothetical protein